MRYFWRSLHYIYPYWKLATASILILLVSTAAGLLAPWPLKILVDHVLGNHPLPRSVAFLFGPAAGNKVSLLCMTVLAGFVITLLANGLAVVDSYVNTRIHLGMSLDVRSDLFKHVQRLPMSFHDQSRAGMVIYLINYQAHAASSLVMSVTPLAGAALSLIGMFWITFQIDRQIAMIAMTVIPLLYYAVHYYCRYIQPRLEEVLGLEGESLSIIHEAIQMLRVIITFGRENHEFRRFRSQGQRAVDARVRVTVRQTLFTLVVNGTTALGTALVLGFGAYHALQGRLTAGQLLVVLAYVHAVYTPLETISTTIGGLQDEIVALRMTFNLLDTPAEIHDAPDAVEVHRVKGLVKYEGVHFSYTGRTETLRNISFEARPGEVIAVVGPTGAGKTTLINLLARLYEVKQGAVSIDGMDIRKIKLESLRNQISMVLQEPLLFSATIADNIRYGRLDASMQDIIKAARDANAHDFIMRLPQQYETQLGERGAKLSGGERQRISVARAFLRGAPILVLDEPTSSIDSRTEMVILDALDRLMTGRTTFVVAHRLSTVRYADRILVVNAGEIVEQGTHEELLQQNGLYKQLHDMQTSQTPRRTRLASASVLAGSAE